MKSYYICFIQCTVTTLLFFTLGNLNGNSRKSGLCKHLCSESSKRLMAKMFGWASGLVWYLLLRLLISMLTGGLPVSLLIWLLLMYKSTFRMSEYFMLPCFNSFDIALWSNTPQLLGPYRLQNWFIQ